MPTDDELAMIDLAAATYRYAGAREAAMADRFGLSPTRFWQKVHALRLRGDVVAVRAGECARLTRLAEMRAAARRGAPYGAASPPMGTPGTRPFERGVG